MQEFLEFVIKELVEYPDELIVIKAESPRKIEFTLRLRHSDAGKVIGRNGKTIKALRNLLNVAAARHGQRASLELSE